MLSLFGFDENVKNVYKLSYRKLAESNTRVTHCDDMKKSYRDLLAQRQPKYPIYDGSLIVLDKGYAEKQMAAYSVSDLNDLGQDNIVGCVYDKSQIEQQGEFVKDAIADLASKNKVFGEIFNLCVTNILLADSNRTILGTKAHGGTTSKCVGLIWLSLVNDIPMGDLQELLVHELTHTLVFIDELNYGHFDYSILSEEKTWAESAILNRRRPLDKVIHSIVVAFEVVSARQYITDSTERVHPDSDSIIRSIERSIASVRKNAYAEQTCRSRVFAILDLVEENLHKLRN